LFRGASDGTAPIVTAANARVMLKVPYIAANFMHLSVISVYFGESVTCQNLGKVTSECFGPGPGLPVYSILLKAGSWSVRTLSERRRSVRLGFSVTCRNPGRGWNADLAKPVGDHHGLP
jgi:hypothetical protein